MSASDRNKILNDESGQLEDVDSFAALSSTNSSINKMAQEDGYSLGVNQGLIDDVSFDAADPESFAAKVEQAEGLSLHYGVPVSPFRDSEAQAISEGLKDMTVPEKIQLANTLSAAPAVWGQLAKKQAGVFTMAGATGDDNLMGAVFKGQELLAAKLAVAPKSSDYLTDFQESIEGVYGTDDAKDIMNSVVAHYASTHSDGDYNSGDFEASIQAVTGGIGKINGFKVELPRGVDDDEFQDFIDDLQPETIEAMGGMQGFSSERAIEMIQAGRLQGVKSGVYTVNMNGRSFESKSNPDQLFTIEWDADMAAKNDAILLSKRRASNKARREQRLKDIQSQRRVQP
jgi:hypothetical protein